MCGYNVIIWEWVLNGKKEVYLNRYPKYHHQYVLKRKKQRPHDTIHSTHGGSFARVMSFNSNNKKCRLLLTIKSLMCSRDGGGVE